MTTAEQVNVEEQNLRWLCEKCGDTVEGTSGKYLNFCKKHKQNNECRVVLVDMANNILADSITDARRKGLIDKKSKPKEPSKASKEEKPDSKVPAEGQPLAFGYYKTEKVVLDARLFLFRDIFIQEDLVPKDIAMGDFLLGCVESLLEVTGRKIAIVQTKGGHD